jgi:hypothetical protein
MLPEHGFKMLWERFLTAIKIDTIPLFDVSRLGSDWTLDLPEADKCLLAYGEFEVH